MRFDVIWRRIKPDAFTNKLEGRFGDRLRRLETLNNWGSLGWLYTHATATKQAHHWGVERNAMAFLAGDEAQRSKYRASFRTAAHVVHWGHLPLSYTGEEALLRAAHVDSDIARVVAKLIDEVIAWGHLACDAKGHACAEDVRSGDRSFDLYRWVSAWLVKRHWKGMWRAIRDASDETGLGEAEVRRAIVRTLVCREDRGNDLLRMCNEADYVPRDLLQAGTAWLTFDIDALWEPNPLGSNAAREWSLINAAREYLDERFFHSPESLLVHTLAARAIAAGMLHDGVTAKDLEALTLAGDDHFLAKLPAYHRKRLVDVRTLATSGRASATWTRVGTFTSVSLPAGSRLDMEDRLTGKSGSARVGYPFSSGVSVIVVSDDSLPSTFAGPGRAFGTVHIHLRDPGPRGDRPRGRVALDVVSRLVDHVGPLQGQLGDAVMSWLLADEAVQRPAGVVGALRTIASDDSATFRRHAERVIALNALGPMLNSGFNATIFQQLLGSEPDSPMWDGFAAAFVRLPWAAYKSAGGKALLTHLRDNAVRRARSGGKTDRGYLLELAVVADQWLASGNPAQRFVFVNTTRLGKDGRPEQEWDVVRIDLIGRDSWEITAAECAVTRGGAKDEQDRARLDYLGQRLEGRFSDLTRYRTLFASIAGGALRYDDARRGFGPVD